MKQNPKIKKNTKYGEKNQTIKFQQTKDSNK